MISVLFFGYLYWSSSWRWQPRSEGYQLTRWTLSFDIWQHGKNTLKSPLRWVEYKKKTFLCIDASPNMPLIFSSSYWYFLPTSEWISFLLSLGWRRLISKDTERNGNGKKGIFNKKILPQICQFPPQCTITGMWGGIYAMRGLQEILMSFFR